MVGYVGPEPERHFYLGEFPKMETFFCNTDLCLMCFPFSYEHQPQVVGDKPFPKRPVC